MQRLTEKTNLFESKNKHIANIINSLPELTSVQASHLNVVAGNCALLQARQLKESTTSQDIAQFTTILMPLIRQFYPRLVAHELLGVQPLNGPTGYIYSLVSRIQPKDRDANAHVVVYKLENHTLVKGTRDVDGEVIIHTEEDMVAATANNGIKKVGETFGGFNVLEVYSGKTVLPRVLKNYTEDDNRDEMRPDINNIGFELMRKDVAAKTRALRGVYSLEMWQDLKSQHGLIGDVEMMELIAAEVQADIDADVINFVNNNAKVLPDYDADTLQNDGIVRAPDVARELALKIANCSSDIAITTHRGVGNIILCSPGVANMLAMLDRFDRGGISSDLSKVGVQTGVVGILDNRAKVIIDPYATEDYVTVLWRGADNRDSMGVFSPYTPLTFSKTIDPATGNNVIFGVSRYALSTVPGMWSAQSNDRAQLYARTFNVTNLRNAV